MKLRDRRNTDKRSQHGQASLEVNINRCTSDESSFGSSTTRPELFYGVGIVNRDSALNHLAITSSFAAEINQDSHLNLVAETRKGNIVGFALGTTYENESGG